MIVRTTIAKEYEVSTKRKLIKDDLTYLKNFKILLSLLNIRFEEVGIVPTPKATACVRKKTIFFSVY